MTEKDICCIGHITHDRIITPQLTTDCAGGTAYYIAWALEALPHDIDFEIITSVGDDLIPEINKLKEKNINIIAHQGTSVFFENSYGINMNNRRQRVLAKAVPFNIAQLKNINAKVFHLGTLLNDDFSADIVQYLATKGEISIDIQGYMRKVEGERVVSTDWNDKLQVLKYTDILKLNEHEIESLTGFTNPRTAAQTISSWGVKEVVITLGSYGSLIYIDKHFYEIPAYPPHRTLDATGCGDTYSAGYLYGRSVGMGVEERSKLAAAMCTLKLEHTGPFDRTIQEAIHIIQA